MTWSELRRLPTYVEGYGRIVAYEPDEQCRKSGRNTAEGLAGDLRPSADDLRSSTDRIPELLSLREAIDASGLRDGMRISFHHHLRMGDRVVVQVLETLEMMGFTGLTLCLSSVMGPACDAIVKAVRAGLVGGIETTGVKGPLAEVIADGSLPFPVIFRSHGGRAAAIDRGRTPIDVAFIAASAVGAEGDLTGTEGPNRFGSLGYAIPDALKAGFVIAITDFVTDQTLNHVSIPGR